VTAGYRRPHEVAVVVHRPAAGGHEFLVLLRAPERQGYWHLVAGGIENGEDEAAAAVRELREETGLDASVERLPLGLSYDLAHEPEVVRVRFAPGTERIEISLVHAPAPAGWEPVLDAEHLDHRWCDAGAAVRLLRWPEPKEAVRVTHALLDETKA
jgi:8-oxo-dGTP diphosphatase